MNRPATVSSLSASETAAHVTAASPSCARDGGGVGLDANRQVVVVDRLPHRLGLPFLARVDAAHRALQLGELEHHVGGEIGLRQPRRASPRARAAPAAPNTSLGNPARQRLDALRLVAVASRASCGTSTCRSRSSRDFERRSCRSASQKNRASRRRADHDALGVLRDDPLVGRLRVDDGEERFLQLAGLGRRTGK